MLQILSGKGLVAHGKLKKRESKSKNKSHSKLKFKKICQPIKRKEIKKKIIQIGIRNLKKKKKENDFGEAIIALDRYESINILFVYTKSNVEEWIPNLRCSFHMTLKQHLFDAYK